MSTVGLKVSEIFNRKVADLYLYGQNLALEAVKEMQDFVNANEFSQSGQAWDNQTKQAMQRLFGEAFKDNDSVGFFLAHGVEYGVYLELANDRKHQILLPTITKYALRYKLYAEELFS